VGGTALALQIGHRKSIDLDFFGELKFEMQELISEIKEFAKLEILSESKNIHVYSINGIKVDFVNYKYPWLDNAVVEDEVILASIKDIAAMKIAAIIGRGTKKDFIDIAFLLQKFSMKEILDLYLLKYNQESVFIALKSLAYFGDAENNIMPDMLAKKSWEQVKKEIMNSVK
jgi:predicted nucleotidyltransferase component of viral defense system